MSVILESLVGVLGIIGGSYAVIKVGTRVADFGYKVYRVSSERKRLKRQIKESIKKLNHSDFIRTLEEMNNYDVKYDYNLYNYIKDKYKIQQYHIDDEYLFKLRFGNNKDDVIRTVREYSKKIDNDHNVLGL